MSASLDLIASASMPCHLSSSGGVITSIPYAVDASLISNLVRSFLDIAIEQPGRTGVA